MSGGMYIAMTFDDGPNAQLTPKLLDMLKERGIKATFFVVGTERGGISRILFAAWLTRVTKSPIIVGVIRR